MSLEEMLRDKQYKQGGLETMVGGSTSVTQPVNLDDIFNPDKEQPDWAKPGPRVSKLNPLVPTHNELLYRRQQAQDKPYATVSYLKPGDTFTDIRKRMQEKSADPRYGTFLQGNIYRKPLEEQPGFSGFYSAYTMDLPTRFDPETFAKAKEANPLMYNIGRGVGHLAKYATGYGMVGPAIEGIKGLQAINNPFVRTMAIEGAKDLVIGGSIGSLEGLIQGKTPGEIAKDMPKQIAYDALANLVFYGAGKAVKGLKGLKPAQQAAGEAAPSWAKSITMPDGKPIQSIDNIVQPKLKEPWQMTKEELANGITYKGKKIKYNSALKNEASNKTTHIEVGDKYFGLSKDAKEYILTHEINHDITSNYLYTKKNYEKAFNSGAFGKSVIDRNGNKVFDGIFGEMKFDEAFTEALTVYQLSPDELLRRYPDAYKYIENEVLKNYPELAKLNTAKVAPVWAKSITMPDGRKLGSTLSETMEDMTRSPRPLSSLVKPGTEAVEVPVKRSDIIKMIDEQLDVPVRTGRFRQRAYGIYKQQPEVIRLRTSNDIYTLAHEVGHHLDNKLGLGGISAKNTQFDSELMKLGQATSRSSYSPKQVRAEGVAEFMRYYLLNPEQAQGLAPKYFSSFEAKIANTGVKETLSNVRQQVQDFVSQSPTQRVLGQISTGKQAGRGITLDKIYAKTFDELQPLKKAVQDMTGGADIPITKDPFKLAELNRGWVGKAETYLHYGIVDEGFNKVGKSLDEILKPVSDRLDDFRAYSVSKRALELADRGIDSGISVDDAVATIRQLNAPEFQKAFTELVGYQDSVLNQLVKSGVLSYKDAATIRALNQNYVPFYRLFDEAGGGLGRSTFANLPSPIKAIKGSSRDIVDPIESIIKNTYVITNIAERNKIGKALVELAESTPGAGRWAEKVATPMFGSRFQLDDIAKALRDAGVDTSSIDLEHVATIFKPSIFAPGKENIVTVFRNGKREFWQLQPDLYRAMMSLDKESSNTLIKLLSFPARILRAGATLNPEFMARNPIRDAFTAHVYSKYGFIPGVDTARGLFHVLKKDDLYWKWKAAGGSHGALVSLDRNYLQSSIKKFTERSLRDKTLNILKNPVEALRVLSEFGEEATRVAEFSKGLKKEGMSKAGIMKAASASRDVTLDFARAGTASKEINKVVAFFNAALQGTDKMARQFKADPAGSSVRALTSITLPSIVLYYINHNNPKYQELPQWQKDFFWIIPVGDTFYRIPKPFELGMIFGTLPERALEFVKTNDKKAFDEYGANLLEAGAPSMIPTALLPIIEAWANKSMFTNLPIVPQSEQRLPESMQYGAYTSETAKALGRLLDISPRKIDNTIKGYGAGLGGYATKGIDLLLTGSGISKPLPKPSTYQPELPMAKAFQVNDYGQSKSVNDFYNELERLESQYSSVRKRFNIPTGETIRLEDLLNVARQKDIGMDAKEVEKLIIYRKVRTELSELRQLTAEVEHNKEMSTAKKKEVITNIEKRMVDLTRVLQGKQPM